MKVAVISTSQAQPCWYALPGWKNWEDEHKRTGAVLPQVSPFFQHLLDAGYEIVVISTRGRVEGPWDHWKTLVDPGNVYCADTSVSCGEEHKTAGCKCYRDNLLKVYARLGLTPPEDTVGYWPSLHYGLKDFGVVTCEGDLLEKIRAGL